MCTVGFLMLHSLFRILEGYRCVCNGLASKSAVARLAATVPSSLRIATHASLLPINAAHVQSEFEPSAMQLTVACL